MTTIVALHGFLGSPIDWEETLGPSGPHTIYPDLTRDFPIVPFDEWAFHFNRQMEQSIEPGRRKILVGYSLGGRLALHALKAAPNMWDGAVIISSHIGLKDETKKAQRLQEDMLWAERMRTIPWLQLMEMWNARDIFSSDTIHPQREEKHYNRSKLAEMLTIWSLGTQEYLQNTISSLRMPILWIVGGKDCNYIERSSSLQFHHPDSSIMLIEGAGHRVPWYPQALLREKIDRI